MELGDTVGLRETRRVTLSPFNLVKVTEQTALASSRIRVRRSVVMVDMREEYTGMGRGSSGRLDGMQDFFLGGNVHFGG
jgi:hypothetical protein